MKHLKRHLLQAYLDGEVSQKKRKRTERHLDECADCREKSHAVRASGELVQSKLDLIEPVPTQDLLPFEVFPAERKDPVRHFIRNRVLASVRVPLIFLFVLCSVILFLSGLLLKEMRQKDSKWTDSPGKKPMDVLNMISADRREVILIPVALDRFRPVENPNILVFQEVRHE